MADISIYLKGASTAPTREELLAYYDEWPRLRCQDNKCHTTNYGSRHFIGTKSEANTVCPLCKSAMLVVIDPTTLDPDLEEDDV